MKDDFNEFWVNIGSKLQDRFTLALAAWDQSQQSKSPKHTPENLKDSEIDSKSLPLYIQDNCKRCKKKTVILCERTVKHYYKGKEYDLKERFKHCCSCSFEDKDSHLKFYNVLQIEELEDSIRKFEKTLKGASGSSVGFSREFEGQEYISVPEVLKNYCKGCVFEDEDACDRFTQGSLSEFDCLSSGIIWKLKENS